MIAGVLNLIVSVSWWCFVNTGFKKLDFLGHSNQFSLEIKNTETQTKLENLLKGLLLENQEFGREMFILFKFLIIAWISGITFILSLWSFYMYFYNGRILAIIKKLEK